MEKLTIKEKKALKAELLETIESEYLLSFDFKSSVKISFDYNEHEVNEIKIIITSQYKEDSETSMRYYLSFYNSYLVLYNATCINVAGLIFEPTFNGVELKRLKGVSECIEKFLERCK